MGWIRCPDPGYYKSLSRARRIRHRTQHKSLRVHGAEEDDLLKYVRFFPSTDPTEQGYGEFNLSWYNPLWRQRAFWIIAVTQNQFALSPLEKCVGYIWNRRTDKWWNNPLTLGQQSTRHSVKNGQPGREVQQIEIEGNAYCRILGRISLFRA